MNGPKTDLRYVNIALTNRCNLKCRMCDIWKIKQKIGLSFGAVDKLISSRQFQKNKEKLDITLTGGEIFLYENLYQIIKLINDKIGKPPRVLATNGILTNNILDLLKKIKKDRLKMPDIHISLDGIKVHDVQRGKRGALAAVLKTIDLLMKNHPEIKIKIKFLITPLNFKEIYKTYIFSQKNNLDFAAKLVESAPNYTNRSISPIFLYDKKSKNLIIKQLRLISVDMIKNGRIAMAKFLENLIRQLNGENLNFECLIAENSVFIREDGEVFLCIHYDSIGNIHRNRFDNLWRSGQAEKIRKTIIKNRCNKCLSFHGSYRNFYNVIKNFPAAPSAGII